MITITGRAGSFLEFKKIQFQSQLNPIHFCSPFFFCLQGQSELCGSYHLLQSCFFFSSVSMANLSRLVAASFSSFALLSAYVSMANLRCLLVTTFSSLSFLQHFTSIFWEWPGAVSRGLLFLTTIYLSSCFLSFLSIFFAPILSLSFLCSLKLCLL